MRALSNFIGGQAVSALSGKVLTAFTPATGLPKPTVPDSDAEDIESAVQAASAILPWWRLRTPEQRAQVLHSIANRLEQAAGELAISESEDQGMPLARAREFEIPRAIGYFRYYAGLILHTEETALPSAALGTLTYSSRRPLGICGLIGNSAHPLATLARKIAPALACGNALVVKPAEICARSAFLLGDLFNEAGVPHGVVNFVLGSEKAGIALAAHGRVAAISFSGAEEAGRKIVAAALPTGKKISLEIDARAQAVVFADADLSEAVLTCVRAGFQGASLQEGLEIFVEEGAYTPFLEKFARMVSFTRMGDPESRETQVGPLLTEERRQDSQSFVARALAEGARLAGGGQIPESLKTGFFLSPAVLVNINHDNPLLTESAWGPVAVLHSITNEKEVLARLSKNPVSLFTSNLARAHRVAQGCESGAVSVNGWSQKNLGLPCGRTDRLGLGEEGGPESLRFFSARKSIEIKI